MFPSHVYRKALFRQPVRMLILIFLLAAVSLAFVSHGAEALLVKKATNRLEQYYQPIGYLSGSWDIRAGQELVSQCPYLEQEDIHQYATGLLGDMQNADVDGTWLPRDDFYHVNEVVFTGRLAGSQFIEPRGGDGTKGYYKLRFEVSSVEAAYGDYMAEGDTVYVSSMPGIEECSSRTEPYYPEQQDEKFLEEYEKLEEGKTYLIYGFYYEWNGVNGTLTAQKGDAGSNFVLQPMPSDGVYFHEVEGAVDYSAPELAGFFDYVEYLRHNQRVMSIVGIKDMSRMPFFQENFKRYYIAEGRMLTEEDNQEENRVCVVHENFARLRGLQVGDTLRFDLVEKAADVEDIIGYAYWGDWERWKDFAFQEAEFEIVGLYNDFLILDAHSAYLSHYSMELFVPDSCLPEGFTWEGLDGTGVSGYSFVLQKPEDQERFLEEYGERLGRLGYTAEFVENNAGNFVQASGELRRSARLGLLLFGTVLAVILPACCGLYLVQRRKEYAVLRALGVPAGRAVGAMAVSFGWAAVPGVPLGCCLGWRQMLDRAEELLEPLENQGRTGEDVSLSSGWLLLMILGILLAVFLILVLGGMFLAGRPVLALLQGSEGQGKVRQEEKRERKTDKEHRQLVGSAAEDAGAAVPLSIPQGRHGKTVVMFCYIGKHILRTRVRSALPLVMGIGAVLLLGWMSRTMADYEKEVEHLYRTTVIEGEIRKTDISIAGPNMGGGQIAPELVPAVERTGLTAGTYWEETALADEVYRQKDMYQDNPEAILTEVSLLGIYEEEEFLEGTGKALEVQFYGGYSWKYFLREREPGEVLKNEVILPEQYIREFDIALGDVLAFSVKKKNGMIVDNRYKVVGFYRENDEASDGISRTMENRIIMPTVSLHDLVGADYYYLVAKFTFDPEKNRELLEREEELKEIVSGDRPYMRLFIWDEELHEVVEPLERTLSLFHILYPVAAVVALALGLGFQLLLLLQRRREAAVMRILGSSAGTVGRLLGAEQLLMCLIGSGLGVLLGILRYGALAGNVWLASGLYVLGSLAGIVAGSMAVSRRSPLDMLQEKE